MLFFLNVVSYSIYFNQTEESKNFFSLFLSRPLLKTRVYIFLINSLSLVVVLLLLQSYDDGRRIFVNKLGSL